MMPTITSSSSDSDLLMKLKRRNDSNKIDVSVDVSASYSLVNKQLITNLILFFGLAFAIYCGTIALQDQEELIHQTEALLNQK